MRAFSLSRVDGVEVYFDTGVDVVAHGNEGPDEERQRNALLLGHGFALLLGSDDGSWSRDRCRGHHECTAAREEYGEQQAAHDFHRSGSRAVAVQWRSSSEICFSHTAVLWLVKVVRACLLVCY